MWLHMVNGQCFRCLNTFEPALRHEIVIIQFANTFPGCQNHFATRKKKQKKTQHKEHELLFTGKGTEPGNLLHMIVDISESIWQCLQTFNCGTQKPLWSFADWGTAFVGDVQRNNNRGAQLTSTTREGWRGHAWGYQAVGRSVQAD